MYVIVGIFINAIRIGEVKTPITENNNPIIPAKYSFLEIDNIPKINAKGLNNGDRIKIPIKPNIILNVPYC